MAKTVKIKITFYNPKELWHMFWTKFFWPRRKTCSTWMETAQVLLDEEIVSNILIEKYYNKGILDEMTCISLDEDIKKAIEDVCNKMIKLINTPLYEE